jgi:hypothetical protein
MNILALAAVAVFLAIAILPFYWHGPSPRGEGPIITAPAAPAWAFDCNGAMAFAIAFAPPDSKRGQALEILQDDGRRPADGRPGSPTA